MISRSNISSIASGAWHSTAHMTDYRTEWLGDVLVERATWTQSAPVQRIGEDIVAGPNYVWLRFWLLDGDQIVDKYFDADGQVVGMYAPICTPIQRRGQSLQTTQLVLALWLYTDGRVVVLNEDEFDTVVASSEVTPVEAEHAEFQIRELTTAIAQDRFPPGLVRNFEIEHP